MILIDSSVWIDFFNGRPTPEADRLDTLLASEPLLIGDIILTEVLQGFRTDRDMSRARDLLGQLHYADMLGRDIALRAAENYRLLRRNGVTVRKTIDVMIATFCIERNHALLHADRDFLPMEKHLGLSVV